MNLLHEHRVLTIHQIQALFFDSAPLARRRMLRLFRLEVVDRFEPPTVAGSAPYHYVLDDLGARILAAHRGVEFRDLGWRKESVERFPWRFEFPHLIETNGFFTRLWLACRVDGRHRLEEWISEEGCRRLFGGACLPDGFGRVAGSNGRCSFLLEFDRGTESPARLAAKLPAYSGIGLLDDHPDALVFCFPDSDREVSARRRLHSPNGLICATTTSELHHTDPLGPIWLPIGSQRRLRLVDLSRRGEEGVR